LVKSEICPLNVLFCWLAASGSLARLTLATMFFSLKLRLF